MPLSNLKFAERIGNSLLKMRLRNRITLKFKFTNATRPLWVTRSRECSRILVVAAHTIDVRAIRVERKRKTYRNGERVSLCLWDKTDWPLSKANRSRKRPWCSFLRIGAYDSGYAVDVIKRTSSPDWSHRSAKTARKRETSTNEFLQKTSVKSSLSAELCLETATWTLRNWLYLDSLQKDGMRKRKKLTKKSD